MSVSSEFQVGLPKTLSKSKFSFWGTPEEQTSMIRPRQQKTASLLGNCLEVYTTGIFSYIFLKFNVSVSICSQRGCTSAM